MSLPLRPLDLGSFQCIEMAVFDTSTLSGGSTYNLLNGASSYQYFTGNGFEADIKILKYYNGGTTGINLSYRQVVSSGTLVNVREDYIPAGATLIIDLQANHADNSAYGSGNLSGRAGQLIWGNGTAGTGNLYISGYR
jgi:hypothetical protein